MKIISFLIGYGVSVGLGYLLIRFVTEKLYKKYGIHREYKSLPALVGICERILYTSVWVTGYQEFIAFWLLTKVGAGWIWQRGPIVVQQTKQETLQPKKTNNTENQDEETRKGANYNIFMIGNALSIIFGILGALIILHWPE